ncbi:MAG: exodeoxyribonuclease VII small subunit [Tissierellia bacterium]|nr:exodeoxyribonuclease VII small subunit [Tissierellia bacterium]
MKIENLSYEQALSELEQIVEDLEKNQLTLEESVKKFKRGVELYNYCSKILTQVEGEIKILLKDDNGNIDEEEFIVEV